MAARLPPGHDIAIAIDVAASQLYVEGRYHLCRAGCSLSPDERSSYVFDLCGKYPIVSIEDPFDQDDWDAWRSFTHWISDRPLQLVGGDLFATEAQRFASGIDE